MFLFLLAACSGDAPDPATVLVELARFASTDLHGDLQATVGESLLGDMAPGESMSGELSVPADLAPGLAPVDGTLNLQWSVAYRTDGTPEIRYWDWVVDVDIGQLALPSADVSGSAEWIFTLEVYDYSFGHHDWSGLLSIDGEPEVPVTWSGLATWSTLNSVEGTIDGLAVSWENDNPDVP